MGLNLIRQDYLQVIGRMHTNNPLLRDSWVYSDIPNSEQCYCGKKMLIMMSRGGSQGESCSAIAKNNPQQLTA